MASTNKPKRNIANIVSPGFTEEDFIASIERSLSIFSSRSYGIEISRISQMEERIKGYDGMLTTLVPFYIQFKCAKFYTKNYSSKLKKDRKSNNLNCNSGFYSFCLHKDRHTQQFEQHNALVDILSLNRLSKPNVAYVAPLFHSKRDLSKLKFVQRRFPWFYDKVIIHNQNIYNFNQQKMFYETISIPPHIRIQQHSQNHCYTYTGPSEVCFHSDPFIVNEGPSLFAEFIDNILNDSLIENVIDDGIGIIKILLKIMELSRLEQNALFRFYLLEIGLIGDSWRGNALDYILNDISAEERLLFAEIVLANELGIFQYVVKALK